MGVTARIVIRVTEEVTGKRRWVPATGKKSDPQGSFYLRYCIGSSPRYEHAGDRYDLEATKEEAIKTNGKLDPLIQVMGRAEPPQDSNPDKN